MAGKPTRTEALVAIALVLARDEPVTVESVDEALADIRDAIAKLNAPQEAEDADEGEES